MKIAVDFDDTCVVTESNRVDEKANRAITIFTKGAESWNDENFYATDYYSVRQE